MWAYYFDKDAPEHKYVEKPVDRAIRSDQIIINTVIVMELSHFLIKNLGPVQGGEKMASFLSFPLIIVDLDYKLTLDSIEELKRYSHLGIGGRDATILAFMRRLASKKIMTHDDALKKIDWLEVVDPIK
ncbi:MAG: type II toxin-antitoxin system VapC family toxin [archaeon]|nr:type II toxin-antitoxin system VapC family toxin [archaeon]